MAQKQNQSKKVTCGRFRGPIGCWGWVSVQPQEEFFRQDTLDEGEELGLAYDVSKC